MAVGDMGRLCGTFMPPTMDEITQAPRREFDAEEGGFPCEQSRSDQKLVQRGAERFRRVERIGTLPTGSSGAGTTTSKATPGLTHEGGGRDGTFGSAWPHEQPFSLRTLTPVRTANEIERCGACGS